MLTLAGTYNSIMIRVETLKNLVLPAIGYFKIIDDKLVSARDFGNNFFVK